MPGLEEYYMQNLVETNNKICSSFWDSFKNSLSVMTDTKFKKFVLGFAVDAELQAIVHTDPISILQNLSSIKIGDVEAFIRTFCVDFIPKLALSKEWHDKIRDYFKNFSKEYGSWLGEYIGKGVYYLAINQAIYYKINEVITTRYRQNLLVKTAVKGIICPVVASISKGVLVGLLLSSTLPMSFTYIACGIISAPLSSFISETLTKALQAFGEIFLKDHMKDELKKKLRQDQGLSEEQAIPNEKYSINFIQENIKNLGTELNHQEIKTLIKAIEEEFKKEHKLDEPNNNLSN